MSEEIINRTYVYHKTQEAKIVSAEEALELYTLGWFDSPGAAADDGAEKVTTLYRRLKGEWIEGGEQPKEVIIESDPFPNELVADALTDGWFRTKQEAGDAPPDQPKGN